MKTEKLRHPVEKLYILGAGASYALSEIKSRGQKLSPSVTPLDKDFLQRLHELTSPKEDGRKDPWSSLSQNG